MVSLPGGMGGWEGFKGRGVNERHWKAQWSSDANCFYSHSSSHPASDFSTSNDLPLLFSLPSSFIPLLICPIHSPFPLFHVIFSPISSPIYPYSFTQISFHRLLPIASPLSYIPSHLSISISEDLLLHLFACSSRKKKGGYGNTLQESVNGLDHYH